MLPDAEFGGVIGWSSAHLGTDCGRDWSNVAGGFCGREERPARARGLVNVTVSLSIISLSRLSSRICDGSEAVTGLRGEVGRVLAGGGGGGGGGRAAPEDRRCCCRDVQGGFAGRWGGRLLNSCILCWRRKSSVDPAGALMNILPSSGYGFLGGRLYCCCGGGASCLVGARTQVVGSFGTGKNGIESSGKRFCRSLRLRWKAGHCRALLAWCESGPQETQAGWSRLVQTVRSWGPEHAAHLVSFVQARRMCPNCWHLLQSSVCLSSF